MRIAIHPSRTKQRIDELTAYCAANVHDGCGMTCIHEQACRASKASNWFYEGQLSHVGRNYDLEINGKPLRIVIVGQEYGHWHRFVSLAGRTEMIATTSANARFAGRNPHMRGTTSLLRLILGREIGNDREGEQLGDGHLFDGFALVNALLCSSLDAPRDPSQFGGGSGRSTSTMRRNCSTHFLRTLEILEPNLIVLQGQGVRQWVGGDLHVGQRGAVQATGRINGHDVDVLTFDHPSAGGQSGYWGRSTRSAYLRETVVPAVAQWRAAQHNRLLAPAVEPVPAPVASATMAGPAVRTRKAVRDTSAISRGVASSWDDPEVRAKRLQRWACVVDGQLFQSTYKACQALGHIYDAGHISWRGKLVEAAKRGESVIDVVGREWRVFEFAGRSFADVEREFRSS